MKHQLTGSELAKYFDHTLLKANATEDDFIELCDEARRFDFRSVAIHSYPIEQCKRLLEGSGVGISAVVSFPMGQSGLASKVFETEDAIRKGADEIDYVINIGAVKDGKFSVVREEMKAIVDLCRAQDVISKVIFENCYLTAEEIRTLSELAREIKPDFIKTSTGFGTGGATVEDIQLMKSVVGDKVRIKASGGVRTLQSALEFIELGASRIGSSSCVQIVEEYRAGLK